MKNDVSPIWRNLFCKYKKRGESKKNLRCKWDLNSEFFFCLRDSTLLCSILLFHVYPLIILSKSIYYHFCFIQKSHLPKKFFLKLPLIFLKLQIFWCIGTISHHINWWNKNVIFGRHFFKLCITFVWVFFLAEISSFS